MFFTTQTAARAFQPTAPIRTEGTEMRDNRTPAPRTMRSATRRRVRFGLAIAAMK